MPPEQTNQSKQPLPNQPLVYLIGVNHAMQLKSAIAQRWGESESVRMKREAFKAHLAEMFDKLAFEILAEEWSDEAKRKPAERETELDEQSARAVFEAGLAQCNYETVLEQFSKAKGIKHRFCDPTSSEKQGLGIEVDPRKETDSDREKRERFWLSKIADCKQRRVLFVCGDDHYDAFAQLLESNGFNVRRGAHYPVSKEEIFAHVPEPASRGQVGGCGPKGDILPAQLVTVSRFKERYISFVGVYGSFCRSVTSFAEG